MTKPMRAWAQRHPLVAYFALAFGLSWGGTGAVMAVTGFSTAPMSAGEAGLFFAMMLVGPAAGGLFLTAMIEGRSGLAALWARMICWRTAPGSYAIALLAAPAILSAILWLLSAFVDPAFAPRFQWTLLGVGLIAGALEEIGWTGFATPRLLLHQDILSAGLLLGLVWAAWHALVDFRYSFEDTGAAWVLEFGFTYVIALVPYRVLMTRLYHRTGSGLLGVVMHASYTGCLLALVPDTSWSQALVWQGGFAAALWLLVAITSMGARKRIHADNHRTQSATS